MRKKTKLWLSVLLDARRSTEEQMTILDQRADELRRELRSLRAVARAAACQDPQCGWPVCSHLDRALWRLDKVGK